MKKESLAEKLARKSFYSSQVQKSWQAHMEFFGPILEPAYIDNYQARIHLGAALNNISRGEFQVGMKRLSQIEKYTETDADHAMWYFAMGLAFEMAGVRDEMVAYYREAGKYNHKFYLPYMKVAKAAHNDAVFDMAEEYYHKTLQCIDPNSTKENDRTILASIYTSLASCLIMMHRYDEAEEMLATSTTILPVQPGRSATEAILWAVKDNTEKAEAAVQQTAEEMPDFVEHTQAMVDRILNKEHPHFFEKNLVSGLINGFWQWFLDNEQSLVQLMQKQEFDRVFEDMQAKLRMTFPFLESDPELGIMPAEDKIEMTFADSYSVSLKKGYETLLQECPEELKKRWIFVIGH